MSDADAIGVWRKAQRVALIERREALDATLRGVWGRRISSLLAACFPMFGGMTVGLCWPYRGEFDARHVARHWRRQGAVTALPEVTGKQAPLQFRKWWPGAPMARGVYGIPFPDGTQVVLPDALIVPMNGFDGQGYRLGYGGGYFDRTLAALDPPPLAVGACFEALRLASIHPQPHDMPMDFVVTEAAAHAVLDGALVALDPAKCGERARELLGRRGLPRRCAGRTIQGYSSPPCYAAEFPGHFGENEN